MILAEKGRIVLDLSPKDWIKEALEQSPVKEAKLSYEIAVSTLSPGFLSQKTRS